MHARFSEHSFAYFPPTTDSGAGPVRFVNVDTGTGGVRGAGRDRIVSVGRYERSARLPRSRCGLVVETPPGPGIARSAGTPARRVPGGPASVTSREVCPPTAECGSADFGTRCTPVRRRVALTSHRPTGTLRAAWPNHRPRTRSVARFCPPRVFGRYGPATVQGVCAAVLGTCGRRHSGCPSPFIRARHVAVLAAYPSAATRVWSSTGRRRGAPDAYAGCWPTPLPRPHACGHLAGFAEAGPIGAAAKRVRPGATPRMRSSARMSGRGANTADGYRSTPTLAPVLPHPVGSVSSARRCVRSGPAGAGAARGGPASFAWAGKPGRRLLQRLCNMEDDPDTDVPCSTWKRSVIRAISPGCPPDRPGQAVGVGLAGPAPGPGRPGARRGAFSALFAQSWDPGGPVAEARRRGVSANPPLPPVPC